MSTLSEQDITCAEELVTVLTPLKTATLALCEEKVPTLSILLPLHDQLINCTMKVKQDDTALIRSVKEAVETDLRKRYEDVDLRRNLTLATLLDPRFKALPFLSDGKKLEAFQVLTVETVKLGENIVIKTEPGETHTGAGPAGEVNNNNDVNEPDLPNLPFPASPERKKIKQELQEEVRKVRKVHLLVQVHL